MFYFCDYHGDSKPPCFRFSTIGRVTAKLSAARLHAVAVLRHGLLHRARLRRARLRRGALEVRGLHRRVLPNLVKMLVKKNAPFCIFVVIKGQAQENPVAAGLCLFLWVAPGVQTWLRLGCRRQAT